MRRVRELRQLQIDGTYTVEASLDLQPTWGGKRKGAGRPRTGVKTKTFSVRVPSDKAEKILARIEPAGYSVAEYIRELLLLDGGKSAQEWRDEENRLINMNL